jgi:hypothetical protein
MQRRVFAGLFLISLFIVSDGGAQQFPSDERPVWTLEFIKVKSENFGPAMGYLDDHWMRVRAEAKRQGAVLDYHRIQNAVLEIPGHKVGDPSSIVLLTEYKNLDAFMESQRLFDSMSERSRWQTGGIVRLLSPEELFETLNTQVFLEEPGTSSGFKLLTKQ